MSSDYSIELQAESINNYKTKQYFQEVLSCYINASFRSAIVMLWTVTVTDIILKLQDLHHIFNDKNAENILKDIKKLQDKNKTSPEWEAKLIELIKPMFETFEIAHIESLHKYRHLSAHPVIKDNLELFHPNKETVRAHIRNILEAVLTKPPMASSKIFELLIVEIAAKKDLFPDIESLQKYLEASYLKNLPDKVNEVIFKNMWKFVFKIKNDDTDKNRKINFKILAIIFSKNQNNLLDFIKNERHYFSSNICVDEEVDLNFFVSFCNKYPKIFYVLDEAIRVPIVEKIKQDNALHTKSIFLYPNSEVYAAVLSETIGFIEIAQKKKLRDSVIEYFQEQNTYHIILNKFIEGFIESSSFNTADTRFDSLIKPYLNDMCSAMLVQLLIGINSNPQLYNRGHARYDNKKIKERCDVILGIDFDYSAFPKFITKIAVDIEEDE